MLLSQRRAGLLLHPTSLPGPADIGDLGPNAHRFVDFLAASGMSVWQMLPLGPTHEDRSPYQCTSVNAGNPALISLEALVETGWLAPGRPLAECGELAQRRDAFLEMAHAGFQAHADEDQRRQYAAFQQREAVWLDDYALYVALRNEHQNQSWLDWPVALRDREPSALDQARQRLAGRIEQVRFEQFVFFHQWHALRDHANRQGVLLFGDMPIFVAHDSAEVWARRECFVLDDNGSMKVVAGVPPDYFSATGQRWGNPHYRWDVLQAEGFDWWVDRLRTQLELFDIIRVDHFRGFEAYWAIPAEEDTAINGRWIKAPGAALFEALSTRLGTLPLVAEDLGVITPEVDALRRRFQLPGMKILQFAFGDGGGNPYLPHNHEPLSVAYTGTHDNDTTLGWFNGLSSELQDQVYDYLGHHHDEDMPWPMIRAALGSVAQLAVVPMQDVLSLGSEHRMNTPGVTEGNWRWRFQWDQLPTDLPARLRHLTNLYGR